MALRSATSQWDQHGNDVKAVLEFFLVLADGLPLDQIKYTWVELLIRASKEVVAAMDRVSDASRLLELGKLWPNFLADMLHADLFTLLLGFIRYKQPHCSPTLNRLLSH